MALKINYFGHSCFKLRGKRGMVVCDPYDQETFGRKMRKTKADIVTISHLHHDHAAKERITGSPFIISGPGEYEVKGISILGVASFHDQVRGEKRGQNTIYLYQMNGLRVCHLGDLGHKLDEKHLEKIGGVDVLLIPVGGVYTLDAEQAVAVVGQIAPKIVIPMHFQQKNLSFELDPVDKFLEEIEEEEIKPVKKLKVTRTSLPKKRKVIWMKK